jgi:hypothetical protein
MVYGGYLCVFPACLMSYERGVSVLRVATWGSDVSVGSGVGRSRVSRGCDSGGLVSF